MSSQKLFTSGLTPDLAQTVSRLLKTNGIPNVLWGNFLLIVYGIPSLTSDIGFVVPDDMISHTEDVFCLNTDLVACKDQHCDCGNPIARPPPTIHFHLATDHFHISIHPQSEVLPNVPDIRDLTPSLISASDDVRLPHSEVGYGSGSLPPQYQDILVPSLECFTHACLLNFAKYTRKADYSNSHDMWYLCWVSYVVEYVHSRGYLDLNSLPKISRDFLVDGFMGNDTKALRAAKAKLVSSVPESIFSREK